MPETEISELFSERQPAVVVDGMGGQFSPFPRYVKNFNSFLQWEGWGKTPGANLDLYQVAALAHFRPSGILTRTLWGEMAGAAASPRYPLTAVPPPLPWSPVPSYFPRKYTSDANPSLRLPP